MFEISLKFLRSMRVHEIDWAFTLTGLYISKAVVMMRKQSMLQKERKAVQGVQVKCLIRIFVGGMCLEITLHL